MDGQTLNLVRVGTDGSSRFWQQELYIAGHTPEKRPVPASLLFLFFVYLFREYANHVSGFRETNNAITEADSYVSN